MSANCSSSLSLCDFTYDNNLVQLVTDPTHCKGNLLDLLITNSPVLIQDLNVSSNSLPFATDHYLILWKIGTTLSQYSKTKSCFIFNFSRANYEGIASHLLEVDFSPCLISSDIEFIWNFMKAAIIEAMEIHIPKLRIKNIQNLDSGLWTGPWTGLRTQ